MTTRLLLWLVAGAASVRSADAPRPAPDLREYVQKALTGLTREDEHRGDFLFKARNVRSELDADGKVTSSQSYVWERVEIDGFPFGRTLERNGKALTPEERKAEDTAIQHRLVQLKATTASIVPNKPRPAKPQEDDWYREFPEAFEFKLAGEESLNGRTALRLEATPRPGYKARNLKARVFEKMNATLWIDKETSELAKADAAMFDSVNVGFGVIGRVAKGTQFHIKRRMLPGGIWLIDSQSMRFDARFMLVKTMRQESATEWTDFRLRPKQPPTSPATRP